MISCLSNSVEFGDIKRGNILVISFHIKPQPVIAAVYGLFSLSLIFSTITVNNYVKVL